MFKKKKYDSLLILAFRQIILNFVDIIPEIVGKLIKPLRSEVAFTKKSRLCFEYKLKFFPSVDS